MSEDLSEARFTPPSAWCPHPERWTSPDIHATEDEVTGLIAALTVTLQPDVVIECGTYEGNTTQAIAEALRYNNRGNVWSLESSAVRVGAAGVFLNNYGNAKVVHTDSLQWTPPVTPIDLIWIDGGDRGADFQHFYPYMTERTIACFHDVAPHKTKYRQQVLDLQEAGLLRAVFLPTPRGVAICQVLK